MRRVFYLTGTRADFGLMLPTLREVHSRAGLSVEIAATGMHLSAKFGSTVSEVRACGLPVVAEWAVDVDTDDGGAMARGAAAVALASATYFRKRRPDICLLLGDRWEMLATAMSAVLAGVPVVHLCGGDRSGSVDDAIRHAISKLAHVHAPATRGAAERLRRMGEPEDRIHVVGAPGLVGLEALASVPRGDWASSVGLDPGAPIAVVLFHPVVQDATDAGNQMTQVLNAVLAEHFQVLCLMPNADAGSDGIRKVINAASESYPALRVVTHLPRQTYVSVLAGADVLVGNSSSGIVEAASFGTPVVNVGDRQEGRERNANTQDVSVDPAAIRHALQATRRWP
ncbi:MAG: UDP-N-acetylglucosamine 2-epimerase (hydrolyzing), partial [Alphaproteobacteria bacterium]|nr:UDP-N-acetylglucosamine 2-epimerase (hydrolyzing) [Alphaproteobacteria bacterium]